MWVLIRMSTHKVCFYNEENYPFIMIIEPHHEKTCLIPYANNKSTDQPAYLHSLISAFVFSYLDSIIPIFAIAKLSRLASLCSWAGPFESYMYLVANPWRQVFSWHGSITTKYPLLVSLLRRVTFPLFLTHICRVDYSILINWRSPFLFLWVADVLFSFSSYFL